MYKFLLPLLLMALSSPSWGRAACNEYEKYIEFCLKQIAHIEADAGSGDGAPIEASRQLRVNGLLQEIKINIDLMQQNKCPQYQDVVWRGKYAVSAKICVYATSKKQEEILKSGWDPKGLGPSDALKKFKELDPQEIEQCNYGIWKPIPWMGGNK